MGSRDRPRGEDPGGGGHSLKLQTKELQNQLRADNTARHAGRRGDLDELGVHREFQELSYDSYFTTPAGHTGITFIASSGDYGFSWYPSASPNVLSVGGTSLSLTSSGSYQSETAWYWSGGGYSPYEPEPSYQSTVQTTGRRSTPDVSFDANSSTGVNIYETSPRSGQGSWRVYGGTSLGAPFWAGIIAIVDQGPSLAGKGSLDGPTQTIPSLYALPETDFRTVRPANGLLGTGGLSSTVRRSIGSDSNGATANIATGLGSPNGPSLIADLVTSTITASPSARTDGGNASPSSRVGLPWKRGALGLASASRRPPEATGQPAGAVASSLASSPTCRVTLAYRGNATTMLSQLEVAVGLLLWCGVLWDGFATIVLPRTVAPMRRTSGRFYRWTWRFWAAIGRKIPRPELRRASSQFTAPSR